MSLTEQQILEALSDAVLNMDEELAAELSRKVIENGEDAYRAIELGLAKGIARAGELFETGEYFVPELLICADAMNAGVEILKPYIKTSEGVTKYKAVIGVVEGDTHDIGKNLVKLMLAASGFDVIDLGRDVAVESFVNRAVEEDAKLILLSSLMTTTMERMEDVVRLLQEKGIKDRFKVAVGGGPVSQAFADKIGADGYAANATEAVRLAKRLLELQ